MIGLCCGSGLVSRTSISSLAFHLVRNSKRSGYQVANPPIPTHPFVEVFQVEEQQQDDSRTTAFGGLLVGSFLELLGPRSYWCSSCCCESLLCDLKADLPSLRLYVSCVLAVHIFSRLWVYKGHLSSSWLPFELGCQHCGSRSTSHWIPAIC